MEILGFKLWTGEDIIAELVSEDEGYVTLGKPGAVYQPQADQIMLQPWPVFNQQDNIVLPRDKIVTRYKVSKQLEDYYLQATSKVQIATGEQTKQILTG